MCTPPAVRHTQRPLTGCAAPRPRAISARLRPGGHAGGGCGQRVGDVVTAGQSQAHRRPIRPVGKGKAHAPPRRRRRPRRRGARRRPASSRTSPRARRSRAMPSTCGSSALSTAMPEAGRARISAAFSSRTPSMDPRNSVCWATTMVTTPIVGAASAVRGRDLPALVRADLDHRRLVLRTQTQKGEREPPLVVEARWRFEHRPTRAQHGGDQLLGGGLATGAGDPTRRIAMRRGAGPPSAACVVSPTRTKDSVAGGRRAAHAARQDAGSPRGHHHVPVAIVLSPAMAKKESPPGGRGCRSSRPSRARRGRAPRGRHPSRSRCPHGGRVGPTGYGASSRLNVRRPFFPPSPTWLPRGRGAPRRGRRTARPSPPMIW